MVSKLKNKNSLEYQLSLVSAPEDFPSELRTLSTLDSNLRCPVCKEYYQAPVIIHIQKCCHTFCSACIRTCFNNNSNNHKIGATGLGGVGNSQRCPICKVEAQEEKIKPVPTLEAAVIAWQDSRDQILKIITRNQFLESQFNNLPNATTSDISKPPKIINTVKKPDQPEPKTRAQKAKISAKRKSPEKADDSDDGIEVLDHDPTDPSAPVKCFMCSTQMLNSEMNAHITKCLDKTQISSSTKKVKTSHPFLLGTNNNNKPIQKRIPLPHFNSLKNKEIKVELSKHKLKSDGTPKIQIRRLSKYITLFNANLDASLPHQKTVEILKKELYEWESLQDLDSKLNGIDNERSYLKSNRDQFASLIDQASKSLQKHTTITQIDNNTSAPNLDPSSSSSSDDDDHPLEPHGSPQLEPNLDHNNHSTTQNLITQTIADQVPVSDPLPSPSHLDSRSRTETDDDHHHLDLESHTNHNPPHPDNSLPHSAQIHSEHKHSSITSPSHHLESTSITNTVDQIPPQLSSTLS
ncbi:hypothetical protein MJO28_003677 [Puccinia striiformis f. sp. tritici]|uniref:Uncharacterized protein n=3 Tax=Puccinia striiformis TaxID=27350 RepID=A0A2S4UKP0_9BASI|nr:hypothetical protein Pst134EA_007693 [Puccinia striiformis f. sp. tritici]POV97888.1 hypothetical protein PSTT_14799 [Puccinia striiformis]KAH9470436.1 hypothetical protein Pst134EA_007693 [Puccinia striiformis f. sp. tritici]KAI7956582.1 hypothetical protein MJO28_003677 [Puccinia striiformis f. sp. tritici]KAI7964207.1 hypothetical protein MJO29_004634 [Puccinia striiformis f. sp. tritici]POV98697.1 hypothetical protein PSHT_13905 [Puccinia striiformis]